MILAQADRRLPLAQDPPNPLGGQEFEEAIHRARKLLLKLARLRGIEGGPLLPHDEVVHLAGEVPPQTGRIGGIHEVHRFEQGELLFRERVEDGPQTALEERGLVGVLPAPHRRARRDHRIDQERQVLGRSAPDIERIEAEVQSGEAGSKRRIGFRPRNPWVSAQRRRS